MHPAFNVTRTLDIQCTKNILQVFVSKLISVGRIVNRIDAKISKIATLW